MPVSVRAFDFYPDTLELEQPQTNLLLTHFIVSVDRITDQV